MWHAKATFNNPFAQTLYARKQKHYYIIWAVMAVMAVMAVLAVMAVMAVIAVMAVMAVMAVTFNWFVKIMAPYLPRSGS